MLSRTELRARPQATYSVPRKPRSAGVSQAHLGWIGWNANLAHLFSNFSALRVSREARMSSLAVCLAATQRHPSRRQARFFSRWSRVVRHEAPHGLIRGRFANQTAAIGPTPEARESGVPRDKRRRALTIRRSGFMIRRRRGLVPENFSFGTRSFISTLWLFTGLD